MTKMNAARTCLFLFTVSSGSFTSADDYTIDPRRTRVSFAIGHAHYDHKVRGRFRELTGTIRHTSAQPQAVDVKVSIPVSSITTNNSFRDNHLLEKFFELQQFPDIEFVATSLTAGEPTVLEGILSIKGITRPVTLTIQAGGTYTDADGREGLRYRATTTLDRHEFDVRQGGAEETGFAGLIDGIQESLDELIDQDVDVTIRLVAFKTNRDAL